MELPQVNDSSARLTTRPALLILILSVLVALQVHAAQFSIDAVKATYLFRFASYVEWPLAARGDGPFTFGVVGAEGVAAHLEQLLTGMTVQGRPATVRRMSSVADLEGVQVLYVGSEAFRGARPIRARAIDMPILIVTDTRDGFAGGAVINFIELNRNLRFEISLDAAERCGLKIDSALLSVAARVDARRVN